MKTKMLVTLLPVMIWGCSTSHQIDSRSDLNVKPIEIKPIHITIDINVKVDRALDDFFDEVDSTKKTKAPEAVKAPEIVKPPVPAKVPEAVKTAESVKLPESVKTAESVKLPEVAKLQESVKAPEAAKPQEPAKAPEAAKPQETK